MSDTVKGVVVAHAQLASALVDATESISGLTGGLEPITNADCTPEELEDRIERAARAGPTLVFADMASGSCAFAAHRAVREHRQAALVTGVSLPMLVDFVFHREMGLESLAERVLGKGLDAATMVPSQSEGSDADRAVPD